MTRRVESETDIRGGNVGMEKVVDFRAYVPYI